MYTLHTYAYPVRSSECQVQLFTCDNDGVKICLYNNINIGIGGCTYYKFYCRPGVCRVRAFVCIRNFNGFDGISNKLMESKNRKQ